LAAVSFVTACSDDGREMREPRAEQNQTIIPPTEPSTLPAGFDTASPDPSMFTVLLPWPSGGEVPDAFVCGGSAPTISWTGVPAGTVGLALVVTDLDVPIDGRPDLPFVHWVIADIDSELSTLSSVPTGAVESINDFASIGWGAPCPPIGQTHTYSFELHALGQLVELPSGSPAIDMVTAIEMASIGTATASGIAQR
jgi:Raf kinase inhibitor-like YbhB/YbcL family protein